MSLMWLYDLPSWAFGTVVVGAFVGFALIGQIVTRRFLARWFGDKHYNDIVGQFLRLRRVFRHHARPAVGRGVGKFRNGRRRRHAGGTEIGVMYRIVDNFPDPPGRF